MIHVALATLGPVDKIRRPGAYGPEPVRFLRRPEGRPLQRQKPMIVIHVSAGHLLPCPNELHRKLLPNPPHDVPKTIILIARRGRCGPVIIDIAHIPAPSIVSIDMTRKRPIGPTAARAIVLPTHPCVPSMIARPRFTQGNLGKQEKQRGGHCHQKSEQGMPLCSPMNMKHGIHGQLGKGCNASARRDSAVDGIPPRAREGTHSPCRGTEPIRFKGHALIAELP